MTPGQRLRAACDSLGWSARATAERVGCDPRLVQRWWAEAPGYTPPQEVVETVERWAHALRAIPLPPWKRRAADTP